MGLVGCIIGLEEIHNTSRKSAAEEAVLSSLEQEIKDLLVENKRIFYVKHEKFSETKGNLL